MPRKRPAGRDDDDLDHATDDESIDIHDAPDPATATPEQARKYNNRSVERVVSMLNVLQESPEPMSLVEIHRSIGMAKATAFRYLWTLEKHRYVERDGSGRYGLGLGFVGMQSRDLDVLKERARPWLERVRDETGETTNLGVLDGNAVRYVEVAESHRTVRMASSPGSRDPLYCTALGKAIAAQLPEEHVRELLEQVEMTPRTKNTITSADEYMKQLTTVRLRGYAVDDGENEDDGRCVAVAILSSRLPAALSVSGPASRFSLKAVSDVAKTLIDIAERLQPTGRE
ncbi:IclR family transcriptional regulator [Jiangella rhizosphaerae]|uniref:IclR family transcriptional regulator n=1 Tax=Jiangella rhizosphaerae TaxID=2293569 RepID=A0A418KQY5_9ACTN|nr:IclR family transcriptional regulator [Jiangella rhizosphaerae]RIQ22845.1 IclR family transcriptional regulator [Jiangella rhizosphaerae]